MCCAPCLVHLFCRSLLGSRPSWPVATHPMSLAVKSLIPYLSISPTGWKPPEAGPGLFGHHWDPVPGPQSPLGLVVCHTPTLCIHPCCTAASTMHTHPCTTRRIWGLGLCGITPGSCWSLVTASGATVIMQSDQSLPGLHCTQLGSPRPPPSHS